MRGPGGPRRWRWRPSTPPASGTLRTPASFIESPTWRAWRLLATTHQRRSASTILAANRPNGVPNPLKSIAMERDSRTETPSVGAHRIRILQYYSRFRQFRRDPIPGK
jgi:hypothetical protein